MLKFQGFCKKFIAIAGMFICVFLICFSWRYTIACQGGEYYFPVGDSVVGNLLVTVGVVLLVGLLGKAAVRWPERVIHIVAVILSLCVTVVLCVIVMNVPYYSQADQVYVFDGAELLYQGIFDIEVWNSYFRVYPYQLRLAKLFSFFLGLAGVADIRVIQVVNALCVGLIVYVGFRITRELFAKPLAELLYLFGALSFIPLELYAVFVYGELLGTCGAMLSIWCFLLYNREESTLRCKIAAGVCGALALSIAFMARAALLVVWIALLIIQVVKLMKSRQWLPLMLTMGMLVVAQGIGGLVQWSVEERYAFALDEGMPNLLPIVMGMQDPVEPGRIPGSYNDYEWSTYIENQMNGELAKEQALTDMQNRLAEWGNPVAAVIFYKDKLFYQWCEPGFNAYALTNQYDYYSDLLWTFYFGTLRNLCNGWLNGYQSVLYGAMLGYFIMLLRRDCRSEWYLPGLILIGEFLFSMLWEAKGRYVFPYIIMMLPAAVMGLYYLGEKGTIFVERIIGKRSK